MTLEITGVEREALRRNVSTTWWVFIPLLRLRMRVLRWVYGVVFWSLSSKSGIWITLWLANRLRHIHPVPKGFGVAVPLTADALRDALSRPNDFNGAEAMSQRLPAGEVVLGIDWERRHDEERKRLEEALDVAPLPDAALIRETVRKSWNCALRSEPDLTRINLAILFENIALDVADVYLGVGTDSADERDHLRPIIRALASRVFQAPVRHSEQDITANLAADKMYGLVAGRAKSARADLKEHPHLQLHQRTILQRLLLLVDDTSETKPIWLNDDWVIRNVATLTVFGSVTSARAMTQAVPQMLNRDERRFVGTLAADDYARAQDDFGLLETIVTEPEVLKLARCTMRKVVFEALRWHPMLSMLGTRTALRDTVLASGTDSMTRVPAGTKVLPLLLGAMHDGKTFKDPGAFCPFERKTDDYLHFGAGPHECVGRRMAEVQMEEIAFALLRHPTVRDNQIRCTKIKRDGPAVRELYITTK